MNGEVGAVIEVLDEVQAKLIPPTLVRRNAGQGGDFLLFVYLLEVEGIAGYNVPYESTITKGRDWWTCNTVGDMLLHSQPQPQHVCVESEYN